ncbi:MAG: hypothetical protein RL154_433 [Pseudomonadota bacterium]|jgi:hypothetical protein
MGKVNIEGVEYEDSELPEEAKSLIASIRFVDQELEKRNSQIAVMQTARMKYVDSLISLVNGKNKILSADTIKF